LRKLSTTSPDRAGGIGGTGCLLVPLMLSCLLLASGCITDDIATIIDIFDPDHGGSPDLAIEEISYLPREPEVGDSITVSVRIRNSGRMRSQETTVSLMVGDAEVSVAQLPRLQGSETITVEFPGSLVLPVGMSVLKGIANPEREGEESRWHNNVAATTILVGEPSFERTFTWEYEGLAWNLDFRAPARDLESLGTDRDIWSYEGYLEYVTPEDRTVRALADALSFYSRTVEYETYDEVSFVLAFVQEMPYTSDIDSKGDNYPRYPIETIADGGGDCEDTSTLLVSILSNDEHFNYGTCLLIIDDHMAAGVVGSEGVGGHSFQVGSRSYYYCETTGKGYVIGELPEVYEGAEIKGLVEVH
jgi:hypothetical protein